MNIKLKPIDYRFMTWKDVFETIQYNIGILQQNILASYTDVEIEQFTNTTNSRVRVNTPVVEDTEWLIFKNHTYLGKREGGPGYTIDNQDIIFDEPLTLEDQVTVMITNGNGLAAISEQYVRNIREIYDKARQLDIDIVNQIEVVNSLKDYLDQSSEDIYSAKRICVAYKDYIEQLLDGTTPDHGDFADEMVAARRKYSLLGERLDTFPSVIEGKDRFLHSDTFRDGDWVFVKEEDRVYLYQVKDQYEGTLPHEWMIGGKVAVQLVDFEISSSIIDRVGFLEDRLSILENRTLMDLNIRGDSGHSEEPVDYQSIKILIERIRSLEDRLSTIEERTLMDLSMNQG